MEHMEASARGLPGGRELVGKASPTPSLQGPHRDITGRAGPGAAQVEERG